MPQGGPAIAYLPEGRVDIQAANANLIEAAPDLLAALKEAVANYASCDIGDMGDGDPIANWKAAIARAEGRD